METEEAKQKRLKEEEERKRKEKAEERTPITTQAAGNQNVNDSFMMVGTEAKVGSGLGKKCHVTVLRRKEQDSGRGNGRYLKC